MRILQIAGICLLIVTLAVGVDARDRDSRDSRDSKSSARSSESRSSSSRQYSGSNDRQSSPSSYSSNRGSSAVSSGSSRTSSAYRPSAGPTRVEPKPASTYTNQQTYSAYRPGGTSNTNTSAGSAYSSNNRRFEPASTYRPSTEQKVEARSDTRTTLPSNSGKSHDIYSAYRPSTGDRSERPVSTANKATQPNSNTYTAYKPDASRVTPGSGNYVKNTETKSPDNRVGPTSGYRHSDNNPSYKPGNQRSDQARDHSAYKPTSGTKTTASHFPSTQSIRDRKLADARTSSIRYRPAADKTHFTYRNYTPPKSYKPPTYRSGYYYYAHPRYTRPYTFGFWSFDYHAGFCHRSLYYHYGLFPYIQITRIVVSSYPRVVYVDRPIYTIYGDRYETSRYPGLDDALADIRSAWISGRLDLLDDHVHDTLDIAILLDGRYDYSVTPNDYLAMTYDALGEMDTVSFVWDKVQQRRDGTITGFATHTYRSGYSTKRVYATYTMQRISGRYYIVEVGSTQTSWD